MSDDDGLPKLRYIGSYEGGTNHIIIPRAPFAVIEQKLEADRVARDLAAEKAKLATMQAARSRGRLKRALRAVLRGRFR
jgi:hypothetical protein